MFSHTVLQPAAVLNCMTSSHASITTSQYSAQTSSNVGVAAGALVSSAGAVVASLADVASSSVVAAPCVSTAPVRQASSNLGSQVASSTPNIAEHPRAPEMAKY